MNKVIDAIPSATMDALCRYHWPGNIRELQNVIERAMITSAGPVLNVDVADLKLSNSTSGVERTNPDQPAQSTNEGLQAILEQTERQQILKALERSWVVAGPHGAAAHLQMNRPTLQIRMRKRGIARGSSQSRRHFSVSLSSRSYLVTSFQVKASAPHDAHLT